MLCLQNDDLYVEVMPQVGGSLVRLDQVVRGARLPLLRPFDTGTPGRLPTPEEVACFPLLPWSNRVRNGFHLDGRAYPIPRNRPDHPWPIHGDGWLLPWRVESATPTRVLLALEQRAAAPFSYRAELTYALDARDLHIRLDVTNLGSARLPFGLGLHPWMPREPGVTLEAPAQVMAGDAAEFLPADTVPIPPDLRFAAERPLPERTINHAFSGWNGRALIRWPDGRRLRIVADVGHYILYTPQGEPFFCFEPVDHVVDAHNLPGGPERHGLTLLDPGRTLSRCFVFGV